MPSETDKDNAAGKNNCAGHRRRLRERFMHSGINGFHEYEILELLLTYAIPRRDVKPLAKELLRQFGSLDGVLSTPASKLAECSGVGDAAVVLLKLVKGLSGYILEHPLRRQDIINTPDAALRFMRSHIGSLDKEAVMVIFTNNTNYLLEYRIFYGTVDRACIYVREIVELALLCHASGVIVAHNHPGGSFSPSLEDSELTRELHAALKTVGIMLHDHFIVSGRGAVSMMHQ